MQAQVGRRVIIGPRPLYLFETAARLDRQVIADVHTHQYSSPLPPPEAVSSQEGAPRFCGMGRDRARPGLRRRSHDKPPRWTGTGRGWLDRDWPQPVGGQSAKRSWSGASQPWADRGRASSTATRSLVPLRHRSVRLLPCDRSRRSESTILRCTLARSQERYGVSGVDGVCRAFDDRSDGYLKRGPRPM